MKILITGADGFIGSHMTEQFVRAGHDVRAFVYYNSFNSWGWLDRCAPDVSANFEVFMGDIRDPHGVHSAISGCDAVIHLAALVAIPYSYHSPHTYIDTNVKGTLNVVQAARDLNIGKIIHTSTSEVYGSAKFVPITEDHPLQGQSPYSASKIGADQVAYSFFSSFDTPVVILRPFNAYGPRQSARAVIPTIITQMLEGEETIRLGSIYPTRDFSYVTDIVNGYAKALENSSCIGEVINLGSNFEISIEKVVEAIADSLDVRVSIVSESIRVRPPKSEVDRLFASNKKAAKLLDWVPRYSGMDGFKEGLSETIDWFRLSENRKYYKSGIYNI